jgi:hypothetical protein
MNSLRRTCKRYITESVDTGTGARRNLGKYDIGDLGILKGTNLKTRRLSKKLDNQLHRPF